MDVIITSSLDRTAKYHSTACSSRS